MVKVRIYIGTVCRATIERPEKDTYRGGFHVGSRAKICPRCLQVWARMEREGDSIFGIESQPCPDCDGKVDLGMVPGALIDDRVSWTVDMDLLDYLPPDLIEREYHLHIKHFERHQANEQPRGSSISIGGRELVERLAADAYNRAFAPSGS